MLYDQLVFIGRFQPFHNGHLAVVLRGLEQAERLLVLVGSAYRPRSIRDPFSAPEREQMIRACLTPEQNQRVDIHPLADAMYNDALWLRNVQAAVFANAAKAFFSKPNDEVRTGLIGHSKDSSSYYLKLFPTWGNVNVDDHGGIHATELRARLFSDGLAAASAVLQQRLPEAVQNWILNFAATAEFLELCEEQAFVNRYQQQFAGLKHPVQHNTADAVVVQAGHVLLVTRGARPGKGQYALPGGFIQPNETALDAALRELREETKLKVPAPVLKGSLVTQQLFDNPHRSTRGRTFTMAFRFDLRPENKLPKVKGSDDAAAAFWLPLAELRSDALFEDHYFILQNMLGL